MKGRNRRDRGRTVGRDPSPVGSHAGRLPMAHHVVEPAGGVGSTLIGLVRRHIDALRRDPFDHPAAADLLRQYREYGYGMIRMIAAVHELHGGTPDECATLAVELEAAYREAVKRVEAAGSGRDGATLARSGARWRKGLQRGEP
jgi:hypothetical protein